MAGKFYIYEHWRPDRNECFYVGKGHGRRAHQMNPRNRMHTAIQKILAAKGTAVEVRIVFSGVSEEEALSLEIERIAFWRADGADLVNLTEGGDGMSGYRHTEDAKQRIRASRMGNKAFLGKRHTPEAIEKTRQKQLGIPKSEETKARMRKPKSEAHKKKISEIRLGKKHTDETIAKMPEAAKAGWETRRRNILLTAMEK